MALVSLCSSVRKDVECNKASMPQVIILSHFFKNKPTQSKDLTRVLFLIFTAKESNDMFLLVSVVYN